MSELGPIRIALADALRVIPKLGQVSPWFLANPTPPCAHIYPGEVEFDVTGSRGLDRRELTVEAMVAQVNDKGAQQYLDLMLAGAGPNSVKEAIEADTELGGLAESLRVTRCTGYRTFVLDGRPPWLGAEWTVEVYVPGS